MKKIIPLITVLFCLLHSIKAQSVIDACFTSVPYGTSFNGSATLANTTDADMLQWNGSQWLGQWGAANVNAPPPCSGSNQKAVWMGDESSWTTGGEGFAMLLDAPLIAGQTYSFTFTYVSNGLYSNGAFAPYIRTNSIADFASAYQMGQLPAVGYSWTSNTYTFTATAAQNNHTWLIIHSNTGSGMMISFCDAQTYVNAGSDTTICIGDSLLLDGGNGYNTYSWSNGATTQTTWVSAAGSYVLLATNACGFGIDTINVSTQLCSQSPVVNLSSSDSLFCEKQCVDFFDLSTNSPTTWQWLFIGASPDTSTMQNPTGICYNNYGSFDVQLIACNTNGCDTLTLTNFITEIQNPTDSIWQIGVTLYSLPAYSYQWYELNSGLISGATDSFYIAQSPGSYYCVVADTVGCIATSNIISVTDASLMEPQSAVMLLYPNPSSGNFSLELNEMSWINSNFKIIDATGRLIFSDKITQPLQHFNLNLPPGIYRIQLENAAQSQWLTLMIR